MKKFLIISILLMPINSYAGAWVNKEGEGSAIHNFYFWQFSKFKDSNGNKVSTNDFSKLEYKPFFEYGVADGYSVGLSPSIQHTMEKIGSAEDTNEALVSADIFLKRRLYQSDEWQFASSVITMVEVPGFYDESETPFFGKKEQFWNVYLSNGINTYSIGNNYGYVNLEVGYRSRFTDSFTGEGGGAVKAELVSSFPITEGDSIVLSLNNTKTVSGYTTGGASFLNKYGYDSTQLGLMVSQALNDSGLKLEYCYIYQFEAKNTGIGSGYKVSLSHKF